jgi:opacity protein-like surface antigen
MLGLRYDFGLSGPFVLEATLGWLTSTRALQDTVPGDTTRMTVGDVDFRAISAEVALRFDITGPRTWHGLLPYVLLGVGFTNDRAAESSTQQALPADVRFNFGTRFTATMGGGIEWLPVSRLGLRVDVRNMLWKLKSPSAFLFGDRALSLPSNQWTQNVAFTAGLSLRF